MIVFERRDQSRAWRTRGAFAVALLCVLSQATWTSAQELTSTALSPRPALNCDGRLFAPSCADGKHDVPGLRSTGRTIFDQSIQSTGAEVTPGEKLNDTGGVRWRRVIAQTLAFQGVQHFFYMTQPKSRAGLKGPWVHDWFESAKSPFVEPHWSDGGPFLVNYIGHPMGGSTYAYIYRQNDPSAQAIEFGTKGYGTHLAKAMGMAAIWSAQWEIGPFSEASLENVGRPPDRSKMAWQDFVITPTAGVAWMAGEDALDRYVIQRLERKIDSAAGRGVIRVLLNPTRSMANVMAGQKPWKRLGRP